MPLVEEAAERDAGVEYLETVLEDVGGWSMKVVSVVLHGVSFLIRSSGVLKVGSTYRTVVSPS